MVGQRLAAQEEHVGLLGKGNLFVAVDAQGFGRAHGLDAAVDGVGVDGVGLRAFQAQHDGSIGAMAFARGAQRTIQTHLDARSRIHLAVVLQRLGEHGCGFHRAHGVGRRWADANLEQVKNA